MKRFQTILVPTDFSPHAAAALAFAVDLAKRTEAAVHLVHVDDFVNYTLLVPGMVLEGSVLANLREATRKRLVALRAEAQKGGVDRTDATVLEGNPYAEIVRHA